MEAVNKYRKSGGNDEEDEWLLRLEEMCDYYNKLFLFINNIKKL